MDIMKLAMKTLSLVVLLALGGPAFSQATTTPEETGEDAAPDPLALAPGEEVAPEGPKVGNIYIESEHGDWDLRCIKAESGVDPCQLYQLLDDNAGNAVAEINIFPLPDAQEAVAGATVITPLETLLTQQLSLAVDSGQAKKYPFSWCSTVGCVARIGLSDTDIASFKRGVKATVTIVPVAAADQKVNIDVSLAGFTAGFDAAKAKLPR